MLNYFFFETTYHNWLISYVCLYSGKHFLKVCRVQSYAPRLSQIYTWFKWPIRRSRYTKWQGSVESVVSFYFVYIRLINASLMVRSTSFRRGSVPSDPHGSTSFVKVPQCTPSNEHIKYHSKLIREVAVTTTPLHLWSLLSGLLLRV